MPAPYTHRSFSEDVLKRRKKILKNKELYYIFNQSFDSLYFYNAYMPLFGKKIRKLGHTAHEKKANLFFKNLLIYTNKNNNDEVKCFLYGMLNHYILDKNIHPYVYYKSGNYKKKLPETHKNNGKHGEFEFNLDAYIYEIKNKKNYKNINIKKELYPKIRFSKNLKICIDTIFLQTYEVNNMGKKFEKSYNTSKFFYFLLFLDRKGYKKKIFSHFDRVTSDRVLNIKEHTTFFENIRLDLFNLENDNWYNIFDNRKKIQNLSVIELYENSIKESIEIIDLIEKFIKNEIQLEKVLKKIGNYSYKTGLRIK